ncbi:hypothetical protein [Alphaproteobacteria bacterium endosymbiont of Tiliacea citrago]|uniref:hypothetical protein n=1 Tax=Alphaproteobacteria bacterium endosymbiont of Tiliacea citrago TaxID=3077944 RepID=UPI00313CF16D
MFNKKLLNFILFFTCFNKSPFGPQEEMYYLNSQEKIPGRIDYAEEVAVPAFGIISDQQHEPFGGQQNKLTSEGLCQIVKELKEINHCVFNTQTLDEWGLKSCFEKIFALEETHIQIVCAVALLKHSLCFTNNPSPYFEDYFNRYKNCLNKIDQRMKALLDRILGSEFFLSDNEKSFFISSVTQPISNCICLECNKKICGCTVNAENGFPYIKGSLIFCYRQLGGVLIPDFFKENAIVLGYAKDSFGENFVAFQHADKKCFYFCSVGKTQACARLIYFNGSLYCVVPNKIDQNVFCYVSVYSSTALSKSCNYSFKSFNFDTFAGDFRFFINIPLVLYSSIVIGSSILFFSMFCANWAGSCYRCGHPAVKFFGGFFNFFLGGFLGAGFLKYILGPTLFFKDIIQQDQTSRFIASFSNFKNISIVNFLRNKRVGELNYKALYVFGSLGLASALFLWSFIWYVYILSKGRYLLNGVSFFAGLSLLCSGFFFGNSLVYVFEYQRNIQMLKADCGTQNFI